MKEETLNKTIGVLLLCGLAGVLFYFMGNMILYKLLGGIAVVGIGSISYYGVFKELFKKN